MSIIIWKSTLAIAALLLAHANALAGTVSGLSVGWINLAAHPESVDAQMRKMLDHDSSPCWEGGALLFMRS